MATGNVQISVTMQLSNTIRMMAQLLSITNELLEMCPASERKGKLLFDAYQIAKQMQKEMEFEPHIMGVVQ